MAVVRRETVMFGGLVLYGGFDLPRTAYWSPEAPKSLWARLRAPMIFGCGVFLAGFLVGVTAS